MYNTVFKIKLKKAFFLLLPAGNFTTIILYIIPKTNIVNTIFNKRLVILDCPE